MTTKEVTIRNEPLGLTPAEVVENATIQAKLLMDIVEKTGCYQNISGKKYLQVEAWETIGAFNRTHAETESINPIIKEGETIGYQAHVQLWKDGIVVGGAIMPAYFSENCCKGKEGDAKHKASMSAAQTFATSKAYRMNYSHVAILAGYQPTPAEEMTGNDTLGGTPTKSEHYCKLHKTNFFKKGKMKAYAHPIAGTNPPQWCNEPEEQPEPTPKPVESPTEAPKAEVRMITPEQSQMIKDFIKTNRVKPDEIRVYTGKQSSKELTEDEASKVLMAIQSGMLGRPLEAGAEPEPEEE